MDHETQTRIVIGESRTQFVYKDGRIEIWCEGKPVGLIHPLENDFGIVIHSKQTMKTVPTAMSKDFKRMDIFFIG